MKRVLSLVTALFFVATLSAQTHYKPKIYIGGKAGATLSKMSFSPGVEQSWLPGIAAGVQFRYTEEKHFGLIAELNIEQRGWQENFKDDAPELSYKRTLTYLQLPLMTHLYFGSRSFKGFVNLGPEFGYMIGNSINSNFDYANTSTIANFPKNRMTDQMSMEIKNRFDYGISGGLGMEYFMSRRNSINLEARFYYGLGNIYPASKRDVFGASRGMSLEVTLGYFFRIK